MQDGGSHPDELASVRQEIATLRGQVSELIALLYNMSVGMRGLADADARHDRALADMQRKIDETTGLIEKVTEVVAGRPHSH